MEARLAPNDSIDNRYVIVWRAGQGKAGGAVYAAKDVHSAAGLKVALKYPVKPAELRVLKALQEKCDESDQECFWMPRVLSTGHYRDYPYAVTEMLGRPLPALFEKLKGTSVGLRWRALRCIGRLLVRRLQAIHQHGFVHCDVQPNNILLHHVAGEGVADEKPFFVDFGTAARYPGGEPQRPDRGSVDFSSINSCNGGVRLPCDDLESVGWVLCFGLFGELPWFEVTRTARWTQGRLSEEDCPVICGQVQQGKIALLNAGAESFGARWDHLADMPLELLDFLRLSNAGCAAGGGNPKAAALPDYGALIAALGGQCSLTFAEAERTDLVEYAAASSAAAVAAECNEAYGVKPEVDDVRTLRNPGTPYEAPHLVKVEVLHAVEEGERIKVEVMSDSSVLDVRMAVLAKLGGKKLSEVKLVRRIGQGMAPTYSSLDDKQPIDERREFLCMGRSLLVPQAVESAKGEAKEFTLERALAAQMELHNRYQAADFQTKLLCLRQLHEFAMTAEFRAAHAELCFAVQREVLPLFGFPATRMGLASMMRAFRPHISHPEILSKNLQINQAIGMSSPPRAPSDG